MTEQQTEALLRIIHDIRRGIIQATDVDYLERMIRSVQEVEHA